MKRNKRAQFFLAMAVLIGVLLIGATSMFNSSKTTSNQDNFNVICNNYYYEAQELNKECMMQRDCIFKTKLEEFTETFVKGKGIEIIYRYGDSTEHDIIKCVEGGCESYEEEFIFQDYKTFQFTMRKENGKEVYVCEK